MEFWAILTIFLGTLGVAGLVSFFVPGLASMLGQIFSAFFNALQQIIHFMVDMLPKPFKILLFIGLFASLGVLAYDFTYGAQFVCTDGSSTVVKVGWLEGIAYKMASNPDSTWKEHVEAQKIMSENTTNPLEITNIAYQIAYQENDSIQSTLMYSNMQSYMGVDYFTTHVLMPRREPVASLGVVTFFNSNDEDIWKSWFGTESSIEYDVCFDARSKTCILERQLPENVNFLTFTDAVLEGSKSPVCNGAFGMYTYIGKERITYYADANNALTVKVSSNFGTVGKIINWFTAVAGVDVDCKAISSADLKRLTTDANGDVKAGSERYFSILGGEPVWVTLPREGIFGGTSPISVPIYDADWVAVFKSKNNTVLSNAVLTGEGPGSKDYSDSDTRFCTGKDLSKCDINGLLAEGEIVKNDPMGLVAITCNTKTDKLHDTTLNFIGINILDSKNMIMFVLIGALFSAIIWIKALIR